MKSLSYLNMILTLLVIVLVANLWVGSSDRPVSDWGLENQAHAARSKGYQTPDRVRVGILSELKKVNSNHAKLVTLLKSGQVQVKMKNASKSKAKK